MVYGSSECSLSSMLTLPSSPRPLLDAGGPVQRSTLVLPAIFQAVMLVHHSAFECVNPEHQCQVYSTLRSVNPKRLLAAADNGQPSACRSHVGTVLWDLVLGKSYQETAEPRKRRKPVETCPAARPWGNPVALAGLWDCRWT